MISSPSSVFEDVTVATPDAAQVGDYTIGVDLGQSQDPTAICVVRKIEDGAGRAIFQIGYLERMALGTLYPHVVAHVGNLMQRLRGNSELVIDSTGVGRAVADMFTIAGLPTINVTIVAGDAITSEGLNFRVPKITLVSRVQALLHSGQLKIHKHLAEAGALVEELQSFRAQVSDLGYWKFGARSGRHDDLVLACSVALWRAAGDTAFSGWGCYEFYRQQFGTPATDREPTALPAPLPPLEPPPEGPQHPYAFGSQATKPQVLVTLKAPAAISGATGLSGRSYTPDPRTGYFRVTNEDAKPLIGHGWTRVDAEPAPTPRWRP
jgi:Terminase RNaseH-like domain